MTEYKYSVIIEKGNTRNIIRTKDLTGARLNFNDALKKHNNDETTIILINRGDVE